MAELRRRAKNPHNDGLESGLPANESATAGISVAFSTCIICTLKRLLTIVLLVVAALCIASAAHLPLSPKSIVKSAWRFSASAHVLPTSSEHADGGTALDTQLASLRGELADTPLEHAAELAKRSAAREKSIAALKEAAAEHADSPRFALPRLATVRQSRSAEQSAQFASEMDRIQQRSCREQMVIVLPSHGMGVDLLQVAGAVLEAFNARRPYRIDSLEGWHYARGACPARDLTCFFESTEVPSQCGGAHVNSSLQSSLKPTLSDALWYISRPNARLQSAVAKRVAEVTLDAPCAAVHVRRADTALNKGFVRSGDPSAPSLYRYIPLEEYLTVGALALQQHGTQQLLLLTDDVGAIDEVHGPARAVAAWRGKWRWIARTRFRGSEGGWENHFPSGDRFDEVVTIFALRDLTRRCALWIGSRSSFGDFLHHGANVDVVELASKNESAWATMTAEYEAIKNRKR
jgi:hypothetical protein